MSHNQEMNPPGRYEADFCTACGDYTPRRLHPGFPHICDDCLFPPDGQRQPARWPDMIEELHRAARNSRPAFFKPFGKELGP